MRAERGILRRATRGAAAGVGGALALAPADALERRVLGRPPVFDLGRVTRRLVERVAGREPAGATATGLGWALRLAYGMGLGAAVAVTRWRAITAAGVITALELWAMPAAGATPPVRAWSPRERWLLLAHTAAFALASRALLRRVELLSGA